MMRSTQVAVRTHQRSISTTPTSVEDCEKKSQAIKLILKPPKLETWRVQAKPEAWIPSLS